MTIPENITRLHDGEEKLREESLRRIEERSDTSAHLVMIEQSMNLFHALLPTMDEPDTDQLTLGNLGISCFNSLTACLTLARPWYHQEEKNVSTPIQTTINKAQ